VAYAPFGEDYAGSGTTDLSFTGQTQDTSTTIGGMYDFQFREYAARQGRWVSPDPAGMAAADPSNPQSWNRYAYVENTPLNSVDPLGLVNLPPGEGGGGGGCWFSLPGELCFPDDPFEPPGPIIPPGGGDEGGGGHRPPGGGGASPPSIGKGGIGNGENFGIPTGMPFPKGNILDLLDLNATPGCDFGVCLPLGDGFNPGQLTWALPWFEAAGGVFARLLGGTLGLLLMQTGDAAPRSATEWSRIPACSGQYSKHRAVCQKRKTSSCWESAAERLATCNASGGSRLGWPPCGNA
jgi:RHS repeat-associated protein